MPELPGLGYREPHAVISTASPGSCVVAQYAMCAGAVFGAGAVWPSANRAYYFPVTVDDFVTVFQLGINVTVQAGNVDVGIYDEQGNRLVSSGSTTVGAAGIQLFNITDTNLAPGGYYLAMCCSDATTAAFTRVVAAAPVQEALGVKQQDPGSVVLPATWTPSASTATTVPLVVAFLNATV